MSTRTVLSPSRTSPTEARSDGTPDSPDAVGGGTDAGDDDRVEDPSQPSRTSPAITNPVTISRTPATRRPRRGGFGPRWPATRGGDGTRRGTPAMLSGDNALECSPAES
jgi:hypothetical protein